MIEIARLAPPDPIVYLDQVAASASGRAYKQQMLTMLDLHPGQTVLDIGCGPGTDLADLAAGVTQTGAVIGIDHNPLMAEQARTRLAGQPIVDIRIGDAHSLPIDDHSVDRARTDRVLQHVAHPSQVLAEFRRVARPGARIAMAEPDWDTLLIDHDDPAMGRGLTRFITTEMIRNATIGRSLARLSVQAGLVVRSVVTAAPVLRDFETADQLWGLRRNVARAIDAGYLDRGAERWIEEISSMPFLASVMIFLVVAEAPS
ncbi:methyltransferase domain-containing protein [Streptosporangium subroseum]|uniref:methyltransferase domain-containing protein n=1 Tax=Streptosporangium subroseum TaxID=106412 RepID=UPI0030869486|nr:methyltransferase domain-containing protein [Streptosporangium subroseum]